MKAIIHCGMYSDTYNPGKKKTTWERFSHNVQYPTKQNYFQNNGFGKRNPFPSVQRWDKVFIWTYNNIAFETTFITE